MSLRVLVTGDRWWTNREIIRAALSILPADTVIIHGDDGHDEHGGRGRPTYRGADRIAGEEAEKLGLAVEVFPANWSRYRLAAGPIRNGQMIREGFPTDVWAFHNDINSSKGTANMIQQSQKAGLTVKLFTLDCPTGALLMMEYKHLPKPVQQIFKEMLDG